MPRIRTNADGDLPLEATRQIDALCDEFEAALKQGAEVHLEPYVDRIDQRWRSLLLEELTFLALDRLRQAGVSNPQRDILAANPSVRDELAALMAEANAAATVSSDYHDRSTGKASGLTVRCPHCHNMMGLIVDASLMEIKCDNCGSTFSLVSDDLDTRDATAVTQVAHFELVERLGMGEFGTVWKARDTILERTVALKIPRREQLDPVSIEKFMREARAAAQLRHPNIIRTHEVGRDKDTLYIVSEYIRGVPLSVMISDHRLGIRESVLMVAKIADALEHAHVAGVIHRDVKPSNTLIDDHGEPHLMDFGLAKRGESEITISSDGAILGTPAYMSPEQARGEAHLVDGRSDIYSLGVILFQLLTGELPFRGSTRMLLHKVINDDPPSPRTLDTRVPKDLDTICLKSMQKEPARRYTAAGDLAADLRRYLAGQPIAARRVGAMGRTLRWARRNRAVALLLTATMTTLLVATLVSSYFGWRAAENAARADQKAVEVTDTLYDSLVQEMSFTREFRKQGYGEAVHGLVNRAQALRATRVDHDELRRQLVLSMGDIVAYLPVVIEPSQGEATSICLSSDGREVFVGLHNGRLVVYDAANGNQRSELEAFAHPVQSMAITADDERLFAVDQSGAARVWRHEGQKWNPERTIQLGDNPYSVFISSEGEFLVSLAELEAEPEANPEAKLEKELEKESARKPGIEVWDVANGTKLRTFETGAGWSMGSAAFDLSNRRLAASYTNRDAGSVGWALWDLDTAELQHQVDMPSLGNTYANGIEFSRNGRHIAIGFDEALLVYGMEDYQPTTFSGFDSTKAVAFSPVNPYLAATNIRGRITVWNSVNNQQLATLYHPRKRSSREDLVFSRDGTHLASSNADSIQVWNLARAGEKTVMNGHEGGIPCAVFHPHGRLLATGGKDDEVRFWHPSAGQVVRSLGLGEAIQALAFSADGGLLAVGCMGRPGAPHLRLIDVESNQVIYTADSHKEEVHSLAWVDSPRGRYLAGCGPNGVALWRVTETLPVSMEEVFTLKRHWCLATVISPEAKWMVWAENDCHLQAWNIISGQERSLDSPLMLQGWHGVAFLPDGESIIYVTKSGVAEVWNVKDNRHTDSFGEPGTFTAPHIALSPDGEWFAAITGLGSVSVWHLPTKQHIFTFRPESGPIWSLAWDPSSEQLAVGQSDGGLAVWHLPSIQQKLAEFGLSWQDDD